MKSKMNPLLFSVTGIALMTLAVACQNKNGFSATVVPVPAKTVDSPAKKQEIKQEIQDAKDGKTIKGFEAIYQSAVENQMTSKDATGAIYQAKDIYILVRKKDKPENYIKIVGQLHSNSGKPQRQFLITRSEGTEDIELRTIRALSGLSVDAKGEVNMLFVAAEHSRAQGKLGARFEASHRKAILNDKEQALPLGLMLSEKTQEDKTGTIILSKESTSSSKQKIVSYVSKRTAGELEILVSAKLQRMDNAKKIEDVDYPVAAEADVLTPQEMEKQRQNLKKLSDLNDFVRKM